ncbi:MAG: YetF domain-containing protein [Gemmatimonadota bacterium]
MPPTIWHDLFVSGVPLAEKILRPILVYIFLVVGLRLAGKRELAQLNPFDLVVLLTLSNAVQNAIIGDDNSVLGGVLGATTLLVVNYFVVNIMYRRPELAAVIEGAPDTLVWHGKVLEHRLEEERITLPELEAAARRQGFSSLKDVDQAILYPGGTFCFIGKVPTAEAAHHHQIMAELHHLRKTVEQLQTDVNKNK